MTGTPSKRKRAFWENVWEEDLDRISPPKAFLFRALRVLYVAGREVSKDHISRRAKELVYSTLLALVPLLAVSFSVLKGLGFHVRYEIVLYYFLEPLGDKGVELSMRLIGFVENAQAGILGSLGVLFLLFTVISLVRRLEGTLNDLWYERHKRNCLPRLAVYMSVILAGPLLLSMAVGFATSLKDIPQIQTFLARSEHPGVVPWIGKIIFFMTVCSVFTFLYTILPDTRVRFIPALSGGIFAGSSWLITGWIFARFIATSARYSAIYSSFATLILFLVWLYWSFLVLLLGARAAFFTQYPGISLLTVPQGSFAGAVIEQKALEIMFLISLSFHRGSAPWTMEHVVRTLRIPLKMARDILSELERNAIVASVGSRHEEAFLPGRELSTIYVKEVLDTVRGRRGKIFRSGGRPESWQPVTQILDDVENVLDTRLGNRSMADLVGSEFVTDT